MGHTALVTGASGYIGSWICQKLLEEGINVHGTVRNLSKTCPHLKKMQDEFPNFKLFEADLLKPGSFAEGMQGCDLVLHTASPFFLNVKSGQKDMLTPAVEGTRNVLNQVNQTPSVTRVVLTSSISATYGDNADMKLTTHNKIDETHWNVTSTVDYNPYQYSKTMAEKEAWKMYHAQEEPKRWSLVSINPALVVGPSMSGRLDSESMKFIKDFKDGKHFMGVPCLHTGFVDVRDVACAHWKAAVLPEAEGRFIVVSQVKTLLDIARLIEKAFPGKYYLPKMELPAAIVYGVAPLVSHLSWSFIRRNVGVPVEFDNARSREILGLEYTPLNESVRDLAHLAGGVGRPCCAFFWDSFSGFAPKPGVCPLRA